MTEAQVVAMVRAEVEAHGVRPLAAAWGVSPAYLCHVCRGRTRPGASILRAMGLERVIGYRKIAPPGYSQGRQDMHDHERVTADEKRLARDLADCIGERDRLIRERDELAAAFRKILAWFEQWRQLPYVGPIIQCKPILAEMESILASLDAGEGAGRPRIVALCGSTRFRWQYEEAFRREEHAGKIALSVPCYKDDPCCKTAMEQDRLDALHRWKIDLADEILVVSDETGYVGESTRREIAYAESLGKPVRRFAEATPAPLPRPDREALGRVVMGANLGVLESIADELRRAGRLIESQEVHFARLEILMARADEDWRPAADPAPASDPCRAEVVGAGPPAASEHCLGDEEV